MGVQFDAPRGKWLCYYCKVLRAGIENEANVTSLPGESRVLAGLENFDSWQLAATKICKILTEYPCSKPFKLEDLQQSNFKSWEDFVSVVMKRVPSDGGNNAFRVLKLFEAIVESDVIFSNK